MVLADAMALQFSRPLFMILLAFLFLGEVAGRQRIAVTFAGFCGILIMLQPFGGGFDPNGIVAVTGAVAAAVAVADGRADGGYGCGCDALRRS